MDLSSIINKSDDSERVRPAGSPPQLPRQQVLVTPSRNVAFDPVLDSHMSPTRTASHPPPGPEYAKPRQQLPLYASPGPFTPAGIPRPSQSVHVPLQSPAFLPSPPFLSPTSQPPPAFLSPTAQQSLALRSAASQQSQNHHSLARQVQPAVRSGSLASVDGMVQHHAPAPLPKAMQSSTGVDRALSTKLKRKLDDRDLAPDELEEKGPRPPRSHHQTKPANKRAPAVSHQPPRLPVSSVASTTQASTLTTRSGRRPLRHAKAPLWSLNVADSGKRLNHENFQLLVKASACGERRQSLSKTNISPVGNVGNVGSTAGTAVKSQPDLKQQHKHLAQPSQPLPLSKAQQYHQQQETPQHQTPQQQPLQQQPPQQQPATLHTAFTEANPPLHDPAEVAAAMALLPWEPTFSGVRPQPEINVAIADFLFFSIIRGQYFQDLLQCGAEFEIEAKLGTIYDKETNGRVHPSVLSECILADNSAVAFHSGTTQGQHEGLNNFLNSLVASTLPENPANRKRVPVKYQRRRELDRFFPMPAEQLSLLPPSVLSLQQQGGRPPKLRITYDQRSREILNKMVKLRVNDMHIHFPNFPLDCRISVNVEMPWNFPTDEIEQLTSDKFGDRSKDRISYTQGPYSVDLTLVTQSTLETERLVTEYELEIELSVPAFLEQARKAYTGDMLPYKLLVGGLVDNARMLARQARDHSQPLQA